MKKINVLICDDHLIVRQGIRQVLADAPDIVVMGEAATGPEAIAQVRDDGVGTTPEALADPQAWGVMGLRERAAHFGGRVGIDTAPGRGTTVRLMLPLAPPLGTAEAPGVAA